MTGSVDPSFISSILGGSNNSLSDDITNTNTNVFGGGNDPTASPILATAVEKLQAFWNNLVGSGNDPTTTQVQPTSVASVLSGSSLGADITATNVTVTANTAAANTAATNASTAIATNQDLANNIVGAQTGAIPTAATSTDAYAALTSIPQSNIQGLSGPTVTYGATGGGGFIHQVNNATASWSHTAVAGDNSIEIVVVSNYPAPTGNNGTSVSVDGVNAVLIKSITGTAGPAGSSYCQLQETWRASITVSGSPTIHSITAKVSAAGNIYIYGQSFSYYGSRIVSVTTWFGAIGPGTTPNSVTLPTPFNSAHRVLAVGSFIATTSGGSGWTGGVYLKNAAGTIVGTGEWASGSSPVNNMYAAVYESDYTAATFHVDGSGPTTAPAGSAFATILEIGN